MRAEFMGVPIDLLTLEETTERAVDAMQTRKLTQHVALNVAKFVKLRHNQELRRDVVESDIVGVDGMGIVWGARALGIDVPERVAGVDLMERVLGICAQRGFRPYFLGGEQEVLARAIASIKRRWPRLVVAGYRNGFEDARDEDGTVRAIKERAPDCLFIGMPTPMKERFLHSYRDVLDVPFVMGVGGGIDVLAGEVTRAPSAVQRYGLEWLYRVYQEPRRMWWRYASTNLEFAGVLGRELVGRAVRGNFAVARWRGNQ